MSNHYLQTCSKIDIRKGQEEEAIRIVAESVRAIVQDGYEHVGINVNVEADGVYLYGKESCNTDHMEEIARALLEGLEIDKPFIASWAYSCSDMNKPDEFGGGAMYVRRGVPTVYTDAYRHIEEKAS